MCGIAGAFTTPRADPPLDLVRALVRAQHTRGPDNQRVELVGGHQAHCVLGHNRLSILDVGERSHQPMWNRAHDRCIVYNGEVYNFVELRDELTALGHQFETTSDTEVILAALDEWGMAALHRFDGMFAFAYFDARDDTLRLARDRFGVKPVYYVTARQQVVFASTATEMARRLGLAPNLAYAASGATHWLYENETSLSPYEGMHAVPAGHVLTVHPHARGLEPRLERYYDFEARVVATQHDIAAASARTLRERVLATIEDSVAIRMRSDVPIAVSLSGGLDSTTVAAIVAERHDATLGFTFGHPDVSDTEAPTVARFGAHAGIEVDYIWPGVPQFVDAFWKTIDAQGAPFASASVVAQYLVYQRVKERGVKVLLGGQGGDEAFMGYRKFHLFLAQTLVREKRWGELFGAVTSLAYLFGAELPRVTENWQMRNRYRNVLRTSVLRLPESERSLGIASGSPLWKRQMGDVTRYSLPTLLRYEDRNAMAHSVESRLPFLDYRIAELGVALPTALKLRRGHGKAIVRDVVRGRVPPFICDSRFKRGFDVQQARWFAGGLGAAIRGRLADHWTALAPYVAPTTDPAIVFSDERLSTGKSAFVDAVTLLWLAQHHG